MSIPTTELRVIETDGTFRRARSSVTRRPVITTEEVGDTEVLARTLAAHSRDIETLQRVSPRPRVIFRVLVETGASAYITTQLGHGLGANVVVRLDSTESEYAGTLAPAINYRTDLSDDTTAVVHIAQSATVEYVAVISIEAV